MSKADSLEPSRRRCLYTLASSMLIISARVSDLPEVITAIKMGTMADPHLCLSEDSRLQETESCSYIYGSEEDDIAAMEFLEKVENDDTQLKETVISQLTKRFVSLPKEKLVSIREQILQEFSPDDTLPTGAPLFMETPYPSSPLLQNGSQSYEEVMTPMLLEDVDTFSEAFRSQSDGKMSESTNNFDLLNVNQLIESVNETAWQVASLTPIVPVPYDQMKSQCEALMNGKQEKLSVLQSFKQQQADWRVMPEEKIINAVNTNQASLCTYMFRTIFLQLRDDGKRGFAHLSTSVRSKLWSLTALQSAELSAVAFGLWAADQVISYMPFRKAKVGFLIIHLSFLTWSKPLARFFTRFLPICLSDISTTRRIELTT
ncbi:hypothetical protein ZIOFF_031057 [Zingiber officinale]|uniref:Uncharacterized protein n=1 Tax=Zingiber officinale TaxID=94328 RepID=A0A8J5GWF8_ZINOF|nr:hypothetical protein ZIOFF_031057 [Zingiber officinale]